MKTLLYFAIGMFVTLTFSQTNTQQNIWYKFQTPASEAVANSEDGDTPLLLRNEHGTPKNYTIPVNFVAMSDPSTSDIIMNIKRISTKYNKKGNLIIYLNGKVDLSCCYNGEMSMDFFDANDNLVQKARTDADGNFTIKSINGSMFEIKNNKIKFNFSKIKTFDQNADVRIATIKRIKSRLESEAKTTQEKSIVKKVVKTTTK